MNISEKQKIRRQLGMILRYRFRKSISDRKQVPAHISVNGQLRRNFFFCNNEIDTKKEVDGILFSPKIESAIYLTTKADGKFSSLDANPLIKVKPRGFYTIRFEANGELNLEEVFIIEYDHEKRINNIKLGAKRGSFETIFNSTKNTDSIAIAFKIGLQTKLALDSKLEIEELKLTKNTGKPSADLPKANKDLIPIHRSKDQRTWINLGSMGPKRIAVQGGKYFKLFGHISSKMDRKTPLDHCSVVVQLNPNGGSLNSKTPEKNVTRIEKLLEASLYDNKAELINLLIPDGVESLDIHFINHSDSRPLIAKNFFEIESYFPWEKTLGEAIVLNTEGSKLRVASILDEFTERCFAPEFDLTPLCLESWRSQFNQNQIDFLLIESAWRGNDGQWREAFQSFIENKTGALSDLFQYAKENEIPTVFWNKEDPPNYDYFLSIAKKCDYIFTTAEECIEKYKRDAPHSRVEVLPFAAQPLIHNPVNKIEHNSLEVAFGGTWYNKKHKDRSVNLPKILDAASRHKLFIFNRQSDELTLNYMFPDRFRKFINTKLSYDEMIRTYKTFKVHLNTNSVVHSNTMFSRRIFEILASYTPVVSTESLGLKTMFPWISVVETKEEAENEMEQLLSSPLKRLKVAHLSHREVLNKHTYHHRAQFISETLFKEQRQPVKKSTAKIAVLALPNSQEELDSALKIFESFGFANSCFYYGVPKGKTFKSLGDPSRVIPIHLESKRFTEIFEKSIKSGVSYLAFIDSKNQYGENYLLDMSLVLLYQRVDLIGKASFLVRDPKGRVMLKNEDQFHKSGMSSFSEGTMISTSAFSKINDQALKSVESYSDLIQVINDGDTLSYSSDFFNFIQKASDEQIVEMSKVDCYENSEDFFI